MDDHNATYRTERSRPDLRRRGGLKLLLAVLFVGSGLAFAACSSGSSSPMTSTHPSSGASGATGSSDAITIKNFAYSPDTLTVAPGATVTVTNKDQVTHTLTAVNGAFNTGDIGPGQSKTITAPKTSGHYSYMCSIHQYMTGTLVVSG